MRISILTSSRADYGIYLPLLKKLNADPEFDLGLIVFGSHLSKFHGFSVKQIEADGFRIDHRVDTLLLSDSEGGISTSMGLTSLKFATLWEKEEDNYDIVFCLGDRFEMFAAVSAAAPFQIKLAHLHGGETTLGAIDNKFRHSISIFADIHFTSTPAAGDRVKQIIGSELDVYCVGALSLDNVESLKTFSLGEFKDTFGIDLSIPSILLTFHPETVDPHRNLLHIGELTKALEQVDYQVIITLPNADTLGNTIRHKLIDFAQQNSHIKIVENFGTQGYFTCLKHCHFLLGNTSSGIIEAASFGRYTIDLGNRQAGREHGSNVIKCEVTKDAILKAVELVKEMPPLTTSNFYWQGGAADKIISILKNLKKC
jgi:GDP/UDP-N,N'-diacetylbacillosamine 2-epimerase (hydrolysing)